MLFLFPFLFLLVLVIREKPYIRWELCDPYEDYLLRGLKVELDPEELHRGKKIMAKVQAYLDDTIEAGGYTLEYVVQYGSFLPRKTAEDACQALQEASKWVQGLPSQCPIEAGMLDLEIIGKVPLELPMGKYTVNIKANRNNDSKPLICINAQAYVFYCINAQAYVFYRE